uniref:Zinc transporter 2 n=1 Tax=Caenorhabditis japonica TaxID=281687 RepID=A0A8R1HK84_CAEJA
MSDERAPLLENGIPSIYNTDDGRKTTVTYNNFHCHDEVDSTDSSSDSNKRATRILWLTVILCLFFMVCEVIGGVLAGSLAIVTDAAHLLTDFASVLISLFSLYIARRPPSQTMSFGFHRAEVLGAFFSVFLIWIVTGVLVVLAVMRIISGDYEVEGGIMAITAALGVIVNLLMLALLYFGGHSHSHGGGSSHSHSHGHSHGGGDNINVRAAFIHVLGDLLQSLGVLVAALFIYFQPSWVIIDPICTLIFSVIVLCTTIYILRDAMIVLLEGRPSNINFANVFSSLEDIEGVKKVHDLRIWSLTMDKVALSVHLEIDANSQSQGILRETRRMLKQTYNVHEITIQIEEFGANRSDCGKCDVPSK